MRRLAALVVVCFAGCGGSSTQDPPAPVAGTAEPRASAAATPEPKFEGAAPCAEGATCSTLRVPLDRVTGKGSLELRIAVQGPDDAPVFVVLSGGPGEPGLPFLEQARDWLGPALEDVRLVSIDQRGTGEQALQCPDLQDAMGASDLTPPPAEAVQDCATKLGDERAFYTTADTVEDLEALRIALGVEKLALDGTSYGTFVAQRYALAHPDHVSALVLDSVVPAEGVSLLSETSMKATRRVLGDETTEALAKVVADKRNGPELLDMLTGLSVGAPTDNGAAEAIQAAANGNDGPLNGLQRGVLNAMGEWTADELSQGLHASTVCADTPAPWGDATAPLEGRREALEAAAAKLDVFPYDRATATGNGFALTCLNWPPLTALPASPATFELPDVPTLLLAGDLDLSTPLEWTQAAAERNPGAKLIVAKDIGHGVQRQGDAAALDAVRALAGSLLSPGG